MKLPVLRRIRPLALILITVIALQIYLIINQPDNTFKMSSKIFLRVPAPQESWDSKFAAPTSPANTSINNVSIRVACIIPYTGASLPVWFDAFAFSAQHSAPLFDFFIFVTEDHHREVPPNVKMIKISSQNIGERIVHLSKYKFSEESFNKSKNSVNKLLELFPYVLVEFKPCLGILFADYIESYSHWALADLDVLIGSMHKLIDHQILNEYDIYTSSFGDNSRLYLRGQLTVHKNNAYVNNVWRNCRHLTDLNDRLNLFAESGFKQWNFQSAEGCYSSVAGKLVEASWLFG